MGEAIRYVFGQRTIAALMGLMLVAGLFATPPVAFMIPGIVEFNLGGGGATLGILTASIGLGSVAGSVALLRLSRRPNKGEPILAGFALAGAAIAGMGASTLLPLSCVLGVLGGFGGVLFIGLSTVVVQSSASDAMRARAMAIWAALFVGMLPFGALITSGLSAWLGAGGAVVVDGILVLVGGALVVRVPTRGDLARLRGATGGMCGRNQPRGRCVRGRALLTLRIPYWGIWSIRVT